MGENENQLYGSARSCASQDAEILRLRGAIQMALNQLPSLGLAGAQAAYKILDAALSSPAPQDDVIVPREVLAGWLSSTEQSLDRMNHIEGVRRGSFNGLPQVSAAIEHAEKCQREIAALLGAPTRG